MDVHSSTQPSDEAPRSIWLMAVLSISVGVIAGFGSWAFRMLIGLVHNVSFLRQLAFPYDANVHTDPGPWGWGIVLIPVAGAVVVTFLVKNYAPEAKGHGVPEVIDAIYYKRGVIRPRVALVKALASAISIGTGGAVGREGPIVQIGSAFGSTLGQVIRMSTHDRVILIAAGSGAGIAATFNAPLGGIIFAVELLMVTVTARTLLLTAAATATATWISNRMIGVKPSFYVPQLELPVFHLAQPAALLLFFPLGALMGLLSVAFIRGIYGMEAMFERIPGSGYTRHALGMLCVGGMMYALLRSTGHYYIEGVGYATIMDVLRGALRDPSLLLLLLGLKLLATSLSLGSGASGGVFSPALFLGATGGAAFGQLCLLVVPTLGVDLATFAIAGMAATIGGSTGAVLTGIVMITEMTGDPSVAIPLIIATSVAYGVRRAVMPQSVYSMKVMNRGHMVPEGLHAPFLSTHTARDAMSRDFAIDRADNQTSPDSRIVIVTDHDRIVGVRERSPADSSDRSHIETSCSGDMRPFVCVGESESLLAVLEAVVSGDADLALVSRRPATRDPADIVGVLTRDGLAGVIHRKRELV